MSGEARVTADLFRFIHAAAHQIRSWVMNDHCRLDPAVAPVDCDRAAERPSLLINTHDELMMRCICSGLAEESWLGGCPE